MANDNSINERGGINVPLSGGGYASIFAHRPLKVKKSKENPKLVGEAYNSKEITEKWMEKTIRDSEFSYEHLVQLGIELQIHNEYTRTFHVLI